mmetsp:Transcript_4115/g.5564  ORF Transcript_4115/g.5564 Transcript_4115/m.5564 type:complete len:523 (-) Transcript_4115:126-1694(-)
MGRGGANMGKLLKGKSRETESKKKTANDKKPAAGSYNEEMKRWATQAARLKQLIAQETENARVNQRLVTTILRNQLRKQKMDELNDNIAILAQEHQREMDRKDSVLQTLQNRLTEVEDQFLVMQRSHMHKLEILNNMHKTKVRQLEAEFERDLKFVKTEFNDERDYINRSHERMKKELQAIRTSVDARVNANADKAKMNHETIREEIKNKNLQVINELRINLETKIDEMEKEFDDAHKAYVDKTKEKNKDFKRLQESDRRVTQENKRTKRKITKLQTNLQTTKHEIRLNREECKSRNKILAQQREIVSQHCRNLKAKISKLRGQEKQRLEELTVRSRSAQKKNEKNVEVAEKILALMETARKMETEREKVLPFYETTKISAEGKEMVAKEGHEFVEDMKHAASTNTAGKKLKATEGYDNWDDLENFHKKYNKVLLDKLAIEQEKLRLQEENRELKMVLQQYLDGITITEDAVNKPNSLMIVNGRVDREMVPVRRIGKTVAVEAQQVHAATVRQTQGARAARR